MEEFSLFRKAAIVSKNVPPAKAFAREPQIGIYGFAELSLGRASFQ